MILVYAQIILSNLLDVDGTLKVASLLSGSWLGAARLRRSAAQGRADARQVVPTVP